MTDENNNAKDALDCLVENVEEMVQRGKIDPHVLNNLKTLNKIKSKEDRKEVAKKYLKILAKHFINKDK